MKEVIKMKCPYCNKELTNTDVLDTRFGDNVFSDVVTADCENCCKSFSWEAVFKFELEQEINFEEIE